MRTVERNSATREMELSSVCEAVETPTQRKLAEFALEMLVLLISTPCNCWPTKRRVMRG